MMLSVSGNMAREEHYAMLAVIAVAAAVVSFLAWRYHEKILELLKNHKE